MRKQKNILFVLSIFIITVAFDFKDNPPSGWYQQFLPNINGQSISDMLFLDSLNGFLITESTSINDTSYILKTTNGGDNWEIKYRAVDDFSTIKFANSTTGFMCGGDLYKTTNSGNSWFTINRPNQTRMDDISVLSIDTFWVIDDNSLAGGVFRTTNGGVNWQNQLSLGSQNPTRIYFYNARIGFITNDGSFYIRKTTNGGVNWSVVVNNEGFKDMCFIDSLTGWRCNGYMKKTTDGGLSWINQPLPQGNYIVTSAITDFSVLNKDTIWGVGGYVQYPNHQSRSMIYTTTNGGSNWLYQVPDTSINAFTDLHVQFINKSYGWAYGPKSGIHTKIGGDPLTAISPASSEIPKKYNLYQNYPNPFNPLTRINYELQITNYVTLKVYDLRGKEIQTLVNKQQSAGSYSVEFDGVNLSSGIYFYTLQTENFKKTKKMLLIK